ncbi:MAG TPA: hypothetical protein VM163_11470 [bacterium]|nr:hypothetical protein [bacterium]
MKRRNVIIGLSVLIVALAVLVFAGEFYGNGMVLPTSGCADDTPFHWYVTYAKGPGESAPEVYLHVYKDGDLYGGDRMMYIDQQQSILVDYKYDATLPAGSYTFEMWTDDDETEGSGPYVYECP